jgi:hypothetical protein
LALTKREREFIEAVSRRQDQLELMIGSYLGGPLGRGLVMIDQEAGDRGFLLNKSNTERNLQAGRLGKKGGRAVRKKIKRKVSPYQKEFGKQLKILKKKHPRTKISSLMRKAHIATRKVRK